MKMEFNKLSFKLSLLVAVTLTGCGAVYNATDLGSSQLGGDGSSGGANQGLSIVDFDGGTVGLRHFRQVMASLSIATGVPVTDTTVARAYTDRKTSLSSDGDATKASAAQLLASLELVSFFCDRTLNDATLRASMFPSVNNLNNAATQLSDASRREAIQNLAARFWRRDPSADEVALLLQLFADLSSDTKLQNNNNTPLTVRDALLGVCTSVGASMEAISML